MAETRTQSGPAGPVVGPRISLVAVLAIVLFLELWLNRIAARLARLDPGNEVAQVLRRLDGPAFFVFELASVLGVILFVAALARLVGSRQERGPLRLSVALVGGVTGVLCALGLVVRLPVRFAAHLHLSMIFLLLVLALGTLVAPASRRLRAGIVLLVLPISLMLVAGLLQRLSAPGVLDPRSSVVIEVSGMALILVGLLAPWLFSARARVSPIAFTMASFVVAGGLALGAADWELSVRLAGIGLGVAVPLARLALPIYVLGAGGFAYAIGSLLEHPGPERLRGVGLFLVCIVGLQLELPYQVAGSLLGMLCLFESTRRPALDAITRDELDALLRRLAAKVGSGQAVVVGAPGRERARIAFATPGGQQAMFQLERRAGAIRGVELSVGEVPSRAPAFSLMVRGASGLGPLAPGAVVPTGEAAFDARYSVREQPMKGPPLLDVETRARIAGLVDGWVGVWPQRGARYRGRALPSGEDALPALTQLLSDLRERAGS